MVHLMERLRSLLCWRAWPLQHKFLFGAVTKDGDCLLRVSLLDFADQLFAALEFFPVQLQDYVPFFETNLCSDGVVENFGDGEFIELHTDHSPVADCANRETTASAQVLTRQLVVKVGNAKSRKRDDNRRVLLVFGNSAFEGVVLRMVNVVVIGTATLLEIEAGHPGSQE